MAKPPLRLPTEAEFAEAKSRAAASLHDPPALARDGRMWALTLLHMRLVAQCELYNSESLQDQRDAVAGSLMAIMKFLEERGFSPATYEALVRPLSALAERENNSMDRLFSERPRAGRPRATLMQHERTGILAAMAEAWLRDHYDDDRPQKLKLAETARKMRGRWFGAVTRAQLQTARELVSQESQDHPAVNCAAMCSGWIDHTAQLFGSQNAFPVMVRFLNDSGIGLFLGPATPISETPGASSREGD